MGDGNSGLPEQWSIRSRVVQAARNQSKHMFIKEDTHGDFCCFRPDIFYEQEHMTKEALVLICGDFGQIWHGNPRNDAELDWL